MSLLEDASPFGDVTKKLEMYIKKRYLERIKLDHLDDSGEKVEIEYRWGARARVEVPEENVIKFIQEVRSTWLECTPVVPHSSGFLIFFFLLPCYVLLTIGIWRRGTVEFGGQHSEGCWVEGQGEGAERAGRAAGVSAVRFFHIKNAFHRRNS